MLSVYYVMPDHLPAGVGAIRGGIYKLNSEGVFVRNRFRSGWSPSSVPEEIVRQYGDCAQHNKSTKNNLQIN